MESVDKWAGQVWCGCLLAAVLALTEAWHWYGGVLHPIDVVVTWMIHLATFPARS